VATVEEIVELLKTLSPAQLEQVAQYVRTLRTEHERNRDGLRSTFGSITEEEAEAWLRAIDDCERA